MDFPGLRFLAILITLHFDALNFRPHLFAHSFRLLRSDWKDFSSSEELIVL